MFSHLSRYLPRFTGNTCSTETSARTDLHREAHAEDLEDKVCCVHVQSNKERRTLSQRTVVLLPECWTWEKKQPMPYGRHPMSSRWLPMTPASWQSHFTYCPCMKARLIDLLLTNRIRQKGWDLTSKIVKRLVSISEVGGRSLSLSFSHQLPWGGGACCHVKSQATR